MRYFWLFSVLFSFFYCSCSREKQYYLEELERLDVILQQKEVYDQYLLDRVEMLKNMSVEMNDYAQIYILNMRIAKEFFYYSVDSTFAYLNKCRSLAEEHNDVYRLSETEIMIAEEYILAGYHLEATDILNKVGARNLPDSLKRSYIAARHYLAKERCAFESDPGIIHIQDSLSTYYRNILLDMFPPYSTEWLELKREEAIQYGMRKEALEYSSMLLSIAKPDSHDYAIACYFYQAMLDIDSTYDRIIWLIRSSMADIMSATKEYSSLNNLAKVLYDEGDINRAYTYMTNYCMPDAIFFGSKLRTWQISHFLPVIGRTYQDKNVEWRNSVTVMFIVIGILFICMIALTALVFIRQHILRRTRNILQFSYRKIERQNKDLLEINEKLQNLNLEIRDSDKVKQEYITLFLGMLSDNIDKTRQYKNHVLKYIRHGLAKDLESEIENMPPIEEDIVEFYKMFDRTFLNLYPDFIDKFNSLLVDGEALIPKTDDSLTAELRVFALIKLGITDSGKIASLLHYSVNTIYNYRAKIKNKAKVSKADFEDTVRML